MRRRALAIALLTTVLAAVPASAQSDGVKDLEAKVEAATQRIIAARVRADEASATYFEAESKLDQLDVELQKLSDDVQQRAADVQKLRDDLRSFAVDRYMNGGASDTSSFFNADDPNQAVARSALADLVGDRKVDVIDKVRVAQAELTARSKELEKQRTAQQLAAADLANNNAKLAKEVAALQAEKDALDVILQGLKEEERKRLVEEARRRAAEEAQRRAEERQRKADEEARKRAERRVAAPTGTIPGPPWQCPIPSGSSFTDTYGQARSGGRRHLGVDMSAPIGTPTVAMVAGDVTYGRDSLGGLSWYLDGDDGNWYYGTHLSRFGPREGHVEPREVIGYVGQSGNASTPHLHLEIHIGGRGNPVNPYPTVAKYC
jgi:murein DD-endopeptidase MepM/ murein hydrolase activator NlpD